MVLNKIPIFALFLLPTHYYAMHNILAETSSTLDQEKINKGLRFFASVNDLAMAQIYLDNGAQVNAQDSHGQTALHAALDDNSLRETPDLQFFINSRHIPSHKEDLVALLLAWKADANLRDNTHHTPMHYAAMYNRIHALELLKKANGNLNALDDLDSTPCHRAVMHNRLEAIAWLGDAGAHMNIIDQTGMSPLHAAVHCEQLQIVDQLLRHGAQLDVITESNTVEDAPESTIVPARSTVFHLAANNSEKNAFSMQRLLLYHGLLHPKDTPLLPKALITFWCCMQQAHPALYNKERANLKPVLMPYFMQSLSPTTVVQFLSSPNDTARTATHTMLQKRLDFVSMIVAAADEHGDTAYKLECHDKARTHSYSPCTLLLPTLYNEQLKQFAEAARANTIAQLPPDNVLKVAYELVLERNAPPSWLQNIASTTESWVSRSVQKCVIC